MPHALMRFTHSAISVRSNARRVRVTDENATPSASFKQESLPVRRRG